MHFELNIPRKVSDVGIEKVNNLNNVECNHNFFSKHTFVNIIVSVTLFSIFLSVFYFTYTSRIEEEILTIQIKNLVNNLSGGIKKLNLDKNQIKKVIDNITLPDLSKQDKEVEDHDNQLKKKAFFIFGIISLVCVILMFIFAYFYNVNVKSIILGNLLLLCFVALTEWFFLNFVAKSYMSLDINMVKRILIEEIEKFELNT